ncbi:hypothetical protein D7V91_12675 [bacterium 1xD42-67]|nr:hypothetical protein D7V91_12675 [bacterium 1xD42-67]
MEFLAFLGWTLLFGTILFLAAITIGEISTLIFSAALLAFLWILLQRLDRIEQKLDALLEQKEEDLLAQK